ncbi:YihY/virulence factor BrkB family protein [Metabacillus arenae]|uniref:YihY/virulence factor BrkB family protein n=1 Tax=Metabacillus arenae TaxID=2771434 RepID=A0A926NFM0_9BACI|nr:YihY/virulence factor BrkB family protein [Metabacillus arenae]MBD1379618.1 YihY/virulence factor BrkB family protein [Metabacillus arenae]
MWLLKELFKRFANEEVAGNSAEIAYFFMLSLFPFLIFLISLVGYLPLAPADILNLIKQYAPADTQRMIVSTLQEILNKQNDRLLYFGIIATLLSGSNGISAIVRAFNRAYEVKESRSFLLSRAISILLTIGMIIVFITALLLPVFGKEIGLFIFTSFGFSEYFFDIWNTIRWFLSAFILFFVFTALYFFAPNKHMSLLDALPGSMFTTIGWIGISSVFSYYVSNFGNYSATYGSIGGIIVLMIWFYLTGMIIILGGELNAILYLGKYRN